MYHVQTDLFSGPLEKLLELIEQKKLDITTISLAEVTADFISYTEELKRAYEEKAEQEPDSERLKIYARLLSDFLVIASQLLWIKSKALLPQLQMPEEEEGEFDLEKQLQLYGSMKPVFVALKKAWIESDESFSRDYMKNMPPVFYPPAGLKVAGLEEAFLRVTQSVGMLVQEEQKIERQLVTLEEKIRELSESVLEGVRKFSSLTNAKTKHEVIVMFLALLHLLRDRTVQVKQSDQFGEIEFSSRDSSGDDENEAQSTE